MRQPPQDNQPGLMYQATCKFLASLICLSIQIIVQKHTELAFGMLPASGQTNTKARHVRASLCMHTYSLPSTCTPETSEGRE